MGYTNNNNVYAAVGQNKFSWALWPVKWFTNPKQYTRLCLSGINEWAFDWWAKSPLSMQLHRRPHCRPPALWQCECGMFSSFGVTTGIVYYWRCLPLCKLLSMQNSNGGYSSYETKRAGGILEMINPSEVFGEWLWDTGHLANYVVEKA